MKISDRKLTITNIDKFIRVDFYSYCLFANVVSI